MFIELTNNIMQKNKEKRSIVDKPRLPLRVKRLGLQG